MTENKLPMHVKEIQLDNVNPEYYFYVAKQTAKILKWQIELTNEAGFIAYTKSAKSDECEKFTLKIENNRAYFKSESTGNQSIDWGKNRANVENFITKIEEQKYFFPFDEFEMRIEEQKLKVVLGKDVKPDDILTRFFSAFKPTEGYFITPILINLNIALFIIKAISDDYLVLTEVESLLNWGANYSPYTLQGEWWRLFTNFFVHGGIVHLLMNMFTLFYVGSLLEPYLGKAKFIAAYLLTGLAASVTSLWWNVDVISLGASGAIMGMFGVFLALLTTNITNKFKRRKLLESIILFVFFNLVYGMKPGVDNAAHVGGLVCGIFIGYALVPILRKPVV